MSAQTRRHYATTLLAMLKRAKAERVIKSHQLEGIILPPAPRNGDPQPWTRKELAIIMGPALRAYEADQAAWNAKVEQEKKNRGLRSPSVVPLRGYCLIGYYTMMRPDCNLHLRWDEVTLDASTLTGWYKLDQHKNVNKGIKAEGPLAEELVDYLLRIRPTNPGNTPIHFNPETGKPYVDIRKQWERLMTIAGRMLGYDLEEKKRTFFNFRHTGASHIAQRGKTPAHLLAVVQMMGDTSVATVNRHYFKMEPELMRELVLGWKRPDVDVPSIASAELFGAEQPRICDMPLALAS
jgi:integrase